MLRGLGLGFAFVGSSFTGSTGSTSLVRTASRGLLRLSLERVTGRDHAPGVHDRDERSIVTHPPPTT